MTLIVTAMIGDYSIIAADRKQSIHPDFEEWEFLFPQQKDTTKIVLHDNVALTGTGNSLILDKIKDYYKYLIDTDINQITKDKSDYFKDISDFKGLNFLVSMVLTNGVFVNLFYFQDKETYFCNFIRSDIVYDNNFKIVILPPRGMEYSQIFNYCQLEFSKLNSYDSQSIIFALKQIFKKISTASKYVSSDFDVVLFPLSTGYSIQYIKN